MQIKQKLAKNTTYNAVVSVINMCIYFVLMPFIIERVGITQFGIYVLASSLVNYFGLLEIGASASIVKHVAEYHARDERDKLSEVVSTTFLFYLGLGLLSCTAISLMGLYLLPAFNIPINLMPKATAVVIILALSSLFIWPLSTFRNTLAGLQRYDLISLSGLTFSILTGIATVLLLLNGYGLVELVILESLSSMIGLIIISLITIHILGFQPIKLSRIKASTAKTLGGFGALAFIIQFAEQISYRTDTIVIGLFLPVGAIAFYEAANKLQGLCARVFRLTSRAVLPAASELQAKNDMATLRKLYLKGSKYTAGITLSVALPLVVFARPLLTYWLGPKFGIMTLGAQVFVSYWFFTALVGLAQTVLVGIGRAKFLSFLVLSRSVLNLALSVALVQYFKVLGVILGTVISEIILYPLIVRYALGALDIPWSGYLKEVVLRVLWPVISTALFLSLLLQFTGPESLLGVAFFSGLTALFFLTGFHAFGMDRKERADFKQFARALLFIDAVRTTRRGGTAFENDGITPV